MMARVDDVDRDGPCLACGEYGDHADGCVLAEPTVPPEQYPEDDEGAAAALRSSRDRDWLVVKRGPDLPATGTRVRLTVDVDRYPHFVAPKGATGTVKNPSRRGGLPVHVGDPNIFAVCLDETLAGAEDWNNEVHWWLDNGDDPTADFEVIEEAS